MIHIFGFIIFIVVILAAIAFTVICPVGILVFSGQKQATKSSESIEIDSSVNNSIFDKDLMSVDFEDL